MGAKASIVDRSIYITICLSVYLPFVLSVDLSVDLASR